MFSLFTETVLHVHVFCVVSSSSIRWWAVSLACTRVFYTPGVTLT